MAIAILASNFNAAREGKNIGMKFQEIFRIVSGIMMLMFLGSANGGGAFSALSRACRFPIKWEFQKV